MLIAKVFSLLNNLYTKDRNRMSFDLIKSELIIRLNFDENCTKFKSFLNTDKGSKMINAAKGNAKYMWQKK